MADERKNRKKAQHRLKRKLTQQQSRREQNARTQASSVKTDILREVSYITHRAQLGDSRIVRLDKLVLFSTHARDAWLLDPECDFAACVCRDGEPEPVRILDTPETFAIDWPAKFTIDGAWHIGTGSTNSNPQPKLPSEEFTLKTVGDHVKRKLPKGEKRRRRL